MLKTDLHSLIKRGDVKSRKVSFPHEKHHLIIPSDNVHLWACVSAMVTGACRMGWIMKATAPKWHKKKSKQLCLQPHLFLLLLGSNYLIYLLCTPRFICLYLETTENSQTSHRTGSRSQSNRTGRVTRAFLRLCGCVCVPVCTLVETQVEQCSPTDTTSSLLLWTYLKGTSLQGMKQE